MDDIDGLDDFLNMLGEIGQRTSLAIGEALEETATEIIAETQSRTPVKTGNLRRSWTHGVVTGDKEKIIELGSSLDYAQSVEEGHKQGAGFVQGKFMLKDSIDLYSNGKFQEKLDKKLKNVGW